MIVRARDGERVVVTDRGVPVVGLVPVDAASLLEELTRRGVLSPPVSTERPRASATPRLRADGPVADLVGEQRR